MSDLVTRIAAQYDNEEGDLTRGALLALKRRQDTSGKRCSRCKLEKRLSAFGPDARRVDGLKSACKACVAKAERQARKDLLRETPVES